MTTETGTRAPRGTSTPSERLQRVQGTLKGLAPDVLTHPNDEVIKEYRQALRSVNKLVDTFNGGH